ncbi:hypothetical protein M8J77_026328 [Diaphorina citri]|nr:hypothetical protein M8J77_026328 [Diaphorina citri]
MEWFQHISKAADKAKSRRPDPSPISGHEIDAASSGDSPHSKTKETEESHSQNLSVPSNSSSVQSAQLNGPSVSSPDLITSKLDTSTPEPVRLTIEEAHLVDPALVTVSHQPVFFAEPVLTPLERLRRKDDMIKQALAEKQQLVADILQVPREEFDTIADLAGEPAHNKEAAELVLAAVSQANQLSAMVNESLRISEDESSTSTTGNPAPPSTPSSGNTVSPGNKMPGVPSVKLQVIANSLNTHLTQLLNLMSERDEERERLRKELQRSRDQLHAMHEASQKSSSRHRSADDPLPPIPSQVATQVSESATSSGGVTPEPSALQTEESAELPEYEQPLEVTPPCTSQATPPSIPETTPPSIPETTPPVEAPPPDATTSVADEVT